jgi:diguanylate cyclase (GGDEF)-like protein
MPIVAAPLHYSLLCHISRFAFSALVLGTGVLHAIAPDWPVDQLQSQCLARSANSAGVALEDSEGFLWVRGLPLATRFDGVNTLSLKHRDGDAPMGALVNYMLELSPQRYWLSESALGIVELDHGKRRVVMAKAGVRAILLEADTVWIADGSELLRYSQAKADVTARYLIRGSVSRVFRIGADLLITSTLGLWRLRDETLTELSAGTDLVDTRVWEVYQESAQAQNTGASASAIPDIYVAARAGVFVLDPNEKASPRLRLFAPDPMLQRIVARNVRRDREGSLWIGTAGSGLFRVTKLCQDDAPHCHKVERMGTREGLASNVVWDLHIDRTGTLWYLADGAGLCRLAQPALKQLDSRVGLSNDLVRASSHDGALSYISGNGGLHVFRAGVAENVALPNQRDSVLFALLPGQAGELWLGGQAGLFRMRNARVEKLFDLPGETLAIAEIGAKSLAFGGQYGLRIWDKNAAHAPITVELPVANALPRSLISDQGALYTVLEQGFFRYQDGAWQQLAQFSNDGANDYVGSLHTLLRWPDTQGRFRALLLGNALSFFDGTRLRLLPVQDLLGPDPLRGGYLASDGKLWVIQAQRIHEIALTLDHGAPVAARLLRSLDASDGINGTLEPNLTHNISEDARGQIWFASYTGALVLDPARPIPKVQALGLSIDRVQLDDDAELDLRSLQFSSAVDRVSIQFAGLDYAAPQRVHYRHRLLPTQSNWVENDQLRLALYRGLVPGDYLFEVQARRESERWPQPKTTALNSTARTLRFQVHPQWFETLQFRIGAGLALICAIIGLPLWRIRSLQRARLELSALVAQRTQDLQLSNAELERLSCTDPLTQLSNRRHFDRQLAHYMAKSDVDPAFLVLLDVDHFKAYNDFYGHPAGDHCLQQLAQVMLHTQNQVGEETAARIGGEEFALLARCRKDQIEARVQALRTALTQRAIAHSQSALGYVSVSIGIAQVLPNDSAAALLARADQALYQAKREGRNCVRWQMGASEA